MYTITWYYGNKLQELTGSYDSILALANIFETRCQRFLVSHNRVGPISPRDCNLCVGDFPHWVQTTVEIIP